VTGDDADFETLVATSAVRTDAGHHPFG
jgi:hypothetical protein